MTHEFILWICVAAYAVHMIEEKVLDWKKWSESKMRHSHFTWNDFYVAHSLKLVIGVCCAMVGWQMPEFALVFPTLMLYNAVFCHIVPTIKHKKVCPGLLSTFALLMPIGIWAYWGANRDLVLNFSMVFFTLLISAFVKWAPNIFISLYEEMT